jgi:polysaccharide biosynthesis/export protein
MKLFLLLLVVLVNGCAVALDESAVKKEKPTAALPASAIISAPASAIPFNSPNTDIDRLARLWQTRSQGIAVSDYPVGPGDVLEISVPAIDELRDRVVRISGEGTISLPFVGNLQAAGLTEDALKQQLVERLTKYMYNPRVVLFVKEYRSRQVAVVGEVVKPGLYSLTSGADTILDVISQAGGMKSGADPRIYLVPFEPVKDGKPQQLLTSNVAHSLPSQDSAQLILKRADPILIDTQELAYGGYQQYLSLAVRPGDLIMVPGGGQVLVEGWVEKPGAYPVSPGLSVTSAIAAAGGALYPADLTAVKVLRSAKGGKKGLVLADLQKIKRGELEDVPLQGGDIVEVVSETSKMIPYGVYQFFTTIVRLGASIPVK